MTGRHVFYEGRVQGVGFRYTTRRIAQEYDVVGWVRNLPDGRVELLVAGEPKEVTGFLDGVAQSELASFIKGTVQHKLEGDALQGLRGFEIRP